jgi:hypothetical protein
MRVATLFDTDEMYDSCERTVSRRWPSWYVIPVARHKPAAHAQGNQAQHPLAGRSVARIRARIRASRYGGARKLLLQQLSTAVQPRQNGADRNSRNFRRFFI